MLDWNKPTRCFLIPCFFYLTTSKHVVLPSLKMIAIQHIVDAEQFGQIT